MLFDLKFKFVNESFNCIVGTRDHVVGEVSQHSVSQKTDIVKLNETVKQLVPLKTIEASTEQLHKPKDHIALKVAKDSASMMDWGGDFHKGATAEQ